MSATGNQVARRGLERALAGGRLPHALLFHGPAGVGKREAAAAVARALLCPHANPAACETCDTCRRASTGLHPDLRFIEADGKFIKVEAVRDVVRESYYRPYEGRAKVYVFPEAHRCNDESANTLLKTLEEPPPSTYLILVTSNREAVLPTLRSRCRAIEFTRLTRSEVRERLIGRHAIVSEEAELRARLADGSESAALAIDLDALRDQRAQALATLVPLAGGRLGPHDADRLIQLADGLAKKEGALEPFLFIALRTLVRDALVIASGADRALLLNFDIADEVSLLAGALGQSGAIALLRELDIAEADLVVNVNKKLVVEALLLGVLDRARIA